MPENIIEVKNVTKTFRISKKHRVLSYIKNQHLQANEKITALDDVSFNVGRGEVLGIIGFNGSGKTTLLQTIAGLYMPDSGHVHVKGSLAPILRIGAGFHQELLPRENIIMYGMLLGLSKSDIKQKVNQILEFAELERFSTMKLKHFSSGMKSRLALSTIFQLNPDILLLDEVLAVGDIGFRQKCFDTFASLRKQEKTILYASHGINTLPELCDRVLLLHMGKIILIGKPKEVIQKYIEIFKQKTS